MTSLWLPLAALVPMAMGPLPVSGASITAQLCGGGTVEIPLRRDREPVLPCPEKGCHAGSCRKRFDLSQ